MLGLGCLWTGVIIYRLCWSRGVTEEQWIHSNNHTPPIRKVGDLKRTHLVGVCLASSNYSQASRRGANLDGALLFLACPLHFFREERVIQMTKGTCYEYKQV